LYNNCVARGLGNVAEKGPLVTVGDPSSIFRKKFRHESVSGCWFL